MEKSTEATPAIKIDSTAPPYPKSAFSKAIPSKEHILYLLKQNRVEDIQIVENPDIKTAAIIPTLRKAKIKMPEKVFQDIATEANLPFLTYTEIKDHCYNKHDCNFLTILPYRVIEKYLIIPLQITSKTASLVTANPFNHKAMMIMQILLGERHVQWSVASSESIEYAVENVFREIHKQSALMDLYYRKPDESAYKVLFKNQKYWIIGTLIAILVAGIINSVLTFAVLFAAINVLYFIINPVKIYVSLKGFQKSDNIEDITPEQMNKARDEDLPVYTVLVQFIMKRKSCPKSCVTSTI
jgi:hypothetical protein